MAESKPEKSAPPRAPLDRAWIVAACVAILAAAAVLIFAPAHSIEKIAALLDRLPPAGQLAILIGAVASAVVMLRNPRGKGPPGGAALALLGALAIGGLASGCGSAASQHRALNVLADTANPTYDLAIESCDEAELFVIARPGTTFEQDEAEMTAIRAACDRVFGGFDALRVAHRLARAAVDGGGDALIAQALAELQAAWDALRALLPEIEGLVTGGGA